MEFFSLPDPGKMLMTPLGNPALAESSANLRAVRGVTLRSKGKQITTFKHYVSNNTPLIRASTRLQTVSLLLESLKDKAQKVAHTNHCSLVCGETNCIPLITFTWAGLRTTVFPAANRGEIFHANIING